MAQSVAYNVLPLFSCCIYESLPKNFQLWLRLSERCDLLGSGNLGFLAELLYEVHRIDMMKKLDVSPTQLQQLIEKNGGHFINDYR